MENIILLGTKDINKANWSNDGIARYFGEFYMNSYKHIYDIAIETINKKGYIYGIGYYVKNIKNQNFYFIKITNAELNFEKKEIALTYECMENSGIKSEMLYGFNGISDRCIIIASTKINLEDWFKKHKIQINSEWIYKEYEKRIIEKSISLDKKQKVFIVHGHDKLSKLEVARFLEKLDIIPIIIDEQANCNKTIIEKIEKYSDVGYGIILYTQCDIGAQRDWKGKLNFRARQNVVFEHGFLMGKLGREKVCALVKEDVELPSDVLGISHIKMDEGWQLRLAKEIKDSGYKIDMNRLI